MNPPSLSPTLARLFTTALTCWLVAIGHAVILPSHAEALVEGVPCPPESTDMEIVFGDLVSCAIDAASDSDAFRFSGVAGENVVIQVRSQGSLRPCLELFAPDSTVTTACSNAFSQRLDVALTQPGTHTILISPFSFTGGYDLALERVAPPSSTAQPIDYGATIEGEIDPSGDLDLFSFSGTAGETIAVQVTSLSSLRPCLELVAPDNTRIVACANAFSHRIDSTLTLSGTYTILVSAFSFSGAYVLALERILPPSPNAQAVQYGSTVQDEISPSGDIDLFFFEASAGARIRLDVASESSLRPCLELIGPDNTRITACENAFSQRIDATLGLTGTYSVLASAFSFSGAYSLSLQCLSPPCLAVPSVTISVSNASVVEGGSVTFTISRTGDTSLPLTVKYTLSGSATLESDYTLDPAPPTVIIPARSSTGTITLVSIDDVERENAETAVLTLSHDPAYVVGTPSTATTTITDNDAAQPDLLEAEVTDPPATITPGGAFRVTDTVRNAGLGTAAPSETRYYLSGDRVWDPADTLLIGRRQIGSLVAADVSTGTVRVRVPATAGVGAYFLMACADDTKLVTEANEQNNCITSETPVEVVMPDLVVTFVTRPPGAAARGSSFLVADRVRNQGEGLARSSETRFYLSRNKAKNPGDFLMVGSRHVPELEPGEESTNTTAVVIPLDILPDSYFLLACADDLKEVRESGGPNNCLASATRVRVTP
jgi:hypothetical protein